ncbi:MAG: VCBS repeat-containing protein [Nanoarchaeota archaeon]|nr:VCBS repeat-containing protein [Nanoarchaeota archaeon]
MKKTNMTAKSTFRTIIAFLLVITLVSAVPTDTFYRSFVNDPVVNSFGGQQFNIGLFTGAATYSYDIKVPPGTNGLAPSISILYNSQNTKGIPDMLGTSWTLTQSYIERDIQYTRSSTADDTFKLVLNGKEHKLIYDSSDSRYHTQRETFFHITKQSGGDNDKNEYWIVKTKDGASFRFGYNTDSELVSNQESYVSRWHLDLVTDTYNNNIYYSYRENPISGEKGAVYPHTIEYNNEKSRKIEFVLESSDRSDQWDVYVQGNNVLYKRRIKDIKVYANNGLVRLYRLSYQQADTSARTFLNKITSYGNDGSTELAATSFDYYSASKGWEEDPNWILPFSISTNKDWGHRFTDVNRDGYIDYIAGYKSSSGSENSEVWLNTKLGWQKTGMVLPYSMARTAKWYDCDDDSNWQYGVDRGFRLLDFNNDGLGDLVTWPHQNVAGNIDRDIPRAAYAGTGTSWSQASASLPGIYLVYSSYDSQICRDVFGVSHGYVFSDLNGDGMTDISRSWQSNRETWINNGNGWSSSSDWQLTKIAVATSRRANYGCPKQFGVDMGLRMLDINGDGLADQLVSYWYRPYDDADDESTKGAWINNGKSLLPNSAWQIPNHFSEDERWDPECYSKFGVDQGWRFADVNDDGLADILRGDSGTREVWLNNAGGWTKDSSWQLPDDFINSAGDNLGMRIIDVNGDGLPDIAKGAGTKKTWINKMGKANLLKTVTNDLGGKIIIDYKQATLYDNTGSDSLSDLNYNIWTVKSITYDNSVSDNRVISTTSYDYKDGFHDFNDKEFRGFNYVEETKHDGTTINHWFHQDDAKKGIEYATEIFDSEGNKYKRDESSFDVTDKGSYFIVEKISDKNILHDKSSFPVTILTEYFYDDYGNIEKISYQGDISKSGDEKFRHLSYNYDLGKWIMDMLDQEQLKNSTDIDVVSSTSYRFNAQGSIISMENWLADGTDPITNYTYDSYGNVISEIDANAHTTIYEYGPTHTFPVTITNAKGHIQRYEYDIGTGNILRETDTNGHTTEYEYDIFGRRKKLIRPYDSEEKPTAKISYFFDGSAPEYVLIEEKLNNSLTIKTYQYFDGLGKLIHTKKGASLIAQDYYYDTNFRLKKLSEPYYSSLSQYVSPTKGIEYQYDPLDRIVKQTNPDGTYKTYTYDRLRKEGYDENNHKIEQFLDVYGRIEIVKEYNEGEIYTTLYSYDTTDNVVQINDSNDNGFYFRYDTLGRKKTVLDPYLGNRSYEYDAASNVIYSEDSEGNKILQSYDEINRLVLKNTSTLSYAFEYDKNLNSTLSEVFGYVEDEIIYSKSFEYDKRLRKTKEIITSHQPYSIDYGYNSMDQIEMKNTNGKEIRYSYDPDGNMQSMGEILEKIEYNANGNPKKRIYANNLTSEFSYYPENSRLEQIKTANLQELYYTYDSKGNVKSITYSLDGFEKKFSYDDLDRLKNAASSSMMSYYNITYSYGSTGNMLSLVSDSCNIVFTYNDTRISEVTFDSEKCFAEYMKIEFSEGWNLVSFPNEPEDSIDYSQIFSFDNVNKKYFVPQGVSPNQSYWLKLDNDQNIRIRENNLPEQQINLVKGWNLIPYLSFKATTVNDALQDVANQYGIIFSYTDGMWEKYSNRPNSINTLSNLNLGGSYWVYVESNQSWVFEPEVGEFRNSSCEVIFRTNKENGETHRYYGKWVAFDWDNDGTLEKFGYETAYAPHIGIEAACNNRETLGYDIDNKKLVAVSSDSDRLIICYHPYSPEFGQIVRLDYGNAGDAINTPVPTEPYTSNGQEICEPMHS